ncbi:hypothetical protein BD779DRAFT_959597 [Infundibulicybe gibba]|nr:hypothetical protein BD779DRAFT_959597 [Infundibulicybe gibba]
MSVKCRKIGRVCTRKTGLARCDLCGECHRVCSLRVDFIRQYVSGRFGLDEPAVQTMMDSLGPLKKNKNRKKPIPTSDAVEADQSRPSSPLSNPPGASDRENNQTISSAPIGEKGHENDENPCDESQVANSGGAEQPSISHLPAPQPRHSVNSNTMTTDEQQQIKDLEEAVEKVSNELTGLRTQYEAREKILLANALSKEQELTRSSEAREKAALEEISAREQELREGFELRAKELVKAARMRNGNRERSWRRSWLQ